jgi:hypothetical protein
MPTPPSVSLSETTTTQPHALPYSILFEELRARRGEAGFVLLLQAWKSSAADLGPPSAEVALASFESALQAVDAAYCNLDQAHDALRDASRHDYANDTEYKHAIVAAFMDAMNKLGVEPAVEESQDKQAIESDLQAQRREQAVMQATEEAIEQVRKQAIEAAHQKVIAAAAACQAADAPLKDLLHRCSSSALCFSGGGIRSASFSLGVLQRLAKYSLGGPSGIGFLHQLSYLSTVSGGGYTGCWLMGWARRSTFGTAIGELGRPGRTAGDPEPDPVRHLRDYTSFLAPRYGFSVDTATLGAIVVRNLFLNWIIFLPCLIVLILAPRLLNMASDSLAAFVVYYPGLSDQHIMLAAAGIFMFLGGCIVGYRASNPPSVSGRNVSFFRSTSFFFYVTVLAAWFIVEAWIAGWMNSPPLYRSFNGYRVLWWAVIFAAASIPLSVGRLSRARSLGNDPFRIGRNLLWGRAMWSVCAGPLSGIVAAVALELFEVHIAAVLAGNNDQNVPNPAFNVFVLPIVLVVLMLGSSLLSGMLSTIEEEEQREWWARAGAVFSIFILVWICAQAVGQYSGILVVDPKYRALLWGTCSTLFGGGAAIAGNSAATAAAGKHVDLTQLTKAGRFLARHQLLPSALSFVALICILLLVGSLNELLLNAIGNQHIVSHHYNTYVNDRSNYDVLFFNSAEEYAIPMLTVAALLLALFANYCINVNVFSLHGMYRMRLVRAFLGASNFGRDADRFTNFDKSDNIQQSELQLIPDAPIHVVNTALNLVHVRKRAWQQRKAESFTFTPFQCGSWRLGYVPTSGYGNVHGVTLGTAMAISGAAFNPNMGYNSSPLVTLLMTLFNARLGWWLPNPAWHSHKQSDEERDRYLRKTGPNFAIASILSEALGKTDDKRKWIQLSDGGHFENLGLYEMVLRRARYIVLVDAGADREFQFEDLGNAIRKINIDLGVPITFPGLAAGSWPFSNKKEPTDRYCAVGKIEYQCVDPGCSVGYLLYIKPQLIGHEPCDITAYAAGHTFFPHETTANQFFTEAQFESYRHLGSHSVDEILGTVAENSTMGAKELMAAAFAYTGQEPFGDFIVPKM